MFTVQDLLAEQKKLVDEIRQVWFEESVQHGRRDNYHYKCKACNQVFINPPKELLVGHVVVLHDNATDEVNYPTLERFAK